MDLSSAGESEGGEEEERHPTSLSPKPVQVRSLAATYHKVIGLGTIFTCLP